MTAEAKLFIAQVRALGSAGLVATPGEQEDDIWEDLSLVLLSHWGQIADIVEKAVDIPELQSLVEEFGPEEV